MSSGRELLVASLAVRLGDLEPGARPREGAGGTGAPGHPLGDLGVATAARLAELERAAELVLAEFAGDVEAALAALPAEVVAEARGALASRGSAPGAGGAAPGPGEAAAPSSAQLPTELAGRYRVQLRSDGAPWELFHTSDAKVVVARDEVLGRDVAFKEREAPGNEALFFREARIASKLDHPVVPPIFELGRRDDGRPYWTRRFVHGTTLERVVLATPSLVKRLPLVPAFHTLCQCLASAHHRGVLHRDLKPEAVMLGDFGEVYVLDWSRARTTAEGAEPGTIDESSGDFPVTGPPGAQVPSHPMSAQQLLGQHERLDERSDVWGLGTLLYEILAGRPPFDRRATVNVTERLARGDTEGLFEPLRRAPRELVAICRRALAAAPADRYRSVEALARDVHAWVEGRRVAAHRYGSLALLGRAVRKRRAWFASVAALLVASIAGVSVSVVGVGRTRDEARGFARLFLDDVSQKLAPVPGTSELVVRVGERALAHFERTSGRGQDSAAERHRTARAFARLCVTESELSRFDEAGRGCAFSERLATELMAEAPGSSEAGTTMAIALEAQARLAGLRGDRATAKQRSTSALTEAEAVLAKRPQDEQTLESASRSLVRLAEAAAAARDDEGARGFRQRALVYERRQALAASATPAALARVADSTRALAELAARRGPTAELGALGDEALSAAAQALTADPKSPALTRALAGRELFAGAVAAQRGDGAKGRRLLEAARERLASHLAAHPSDLAAAALAVQAQALTGRWADALDLVRRAERAGAGPKLGVAAAAVVLVSGDAAGARRLGELAAPNGGGEAVRGLGAELERCGAVAADPCRARALETFVARAAVGAP